MAIAKWWKVDFHTHTPASNCFKDKSVKPEEWIKAALDKELDAVVVTDHNSAEWIERLQGVKQKDKKLVIFPGIELCVGTNFIHILIIFDPTTKQEEIRKFLIKGCITDYANTDKQVSEEALARLIEEYDRKILVIPAHFNKNKGLCKELRQNGIYEFTQKIRIDAIEVRDENDISEFQNKVKNNIIKECALVVGSDNPDKEGKGHAIDGFGNAYTYVKMSEPTIEGMRQAILDPETRIKSVLKNDECPENLNVVTHNYVAGVHISKLLHVNDINLRFSPNLNCIIGGRGTGKSTIVEMLRLGLEKYEEEVYQKDIIKNTFQKDSSIDIYYNFGSNNEFKISALGDKKDKPKYQYENNHGKLNSAPDFPVAIYSQKEIYSLAEDDGNPEKLESSPLLKIIDDNIIKAKMSNDEGIREKEKEIIRLTQELDNLKSEMKDIPKIKAEIQLGLAKIQKFNDTGVIEKRKVFNERKCVHDEIKNSIEEYSNKLKEVKECIEKETLLLSDRLKGLNIDIGNEFIEQIEQINTEIKDIIENNEVKMSEIADKLEKSEVTTLLKEVKEDYEKAVESLGEIGIDNYKAEEENLNNQKEKLEKLEKKNEEKEKKVELIIEKINEYMEEKESLFNLRTDIINKINESTTNIKIELKYLSHGERWLFRLRRELGKQGAFDENFKNLYKFIFEDGVANKDRIKKWLIFLLTTEDGDIRSLLGEELKLDPRFENIWKEKYKMGTLSGLMKIIPEDRVKIKIVNNELEIDINEGSPGQRSAAILAFILSQGTAPLIIDQPEDDLDNSLIINLIVENIRNIKSNRQIIIVTHNPNIPVLGDAEGIIMLDRDKDGKVVFKNNKKTGCIEEKTIKKGICDIMEGGLEAFKKRESKYRI